MSYCTYCGSKLLDGAKFCIECGQKVEYFPAPTAPAAGNDAEVSPSPSAAPEKKQSRFVAALPAIGRFLGRCLCAVLILAILFLVVCYFIGDDKAEGSAGSVPTASANVKQEGLAAFKGRYRLTDYTVLDNPFNARSENEQSSYIDFDGNGGGSAQILGKEYEIQSVESHRITMTNGDVLDCTVEGDSLTVIFDNCSLTFGKK